MSRPERSSPKRLEEEEAIAFRSRLPPFNRKQVSDFVGIVTLYKEKLSLNNWSIVSTAVTNLANVRNMCRGEIRTPSPGIPGYVDEQFTKNSYDVAYIIVKSVSEVDVKDIENETLQRLMNQSFYTKVGFSVGFFDDLGYYTDVICADQGYGGLLLNYIAESMFPYTVSLSALEKVLGYYPKFYYKFGSSCDDTFVLPPEVTREVKDAFAKPRHYKNKVVKETLKKLYDNNVGNGPPDCKENPYRPVCVENGFKMKFCRKNLNLSGISVEKNNAKKSKLIKRRIRQTELEMLGPAEELPPRSNVGPMGRERRETTSRVSRSPRPPRL